MASNTDLAISLSVRMGNLEAGLRNTQTSLKATERAAKATQQSVAALGRQAQQSGGFLASFGGRLTEGFAQARASFVGMVAAMTVGSLTSALSGAVQQLTALADAAGQVGLTAQQLQALQLSFREAGAGAGVAENAVSKFNDLLGDAQRGNEDAQKAFVAMGVSFRNVDGSARTASEAFDDVMARIRDTTSATEQFSLASQAFGARNARYVVAALGEMDDSLDGTVEKWRELGLIVADDVPQKLDELGSSFERLGTTIVNAIGTAIASVQPTLSGFLEWAQRAIVQVIGTINSIQGAVMRAGRWIGEGLGTIERSPQRVAQLALGRAESEFTEARIALTEANRRLQLATDNASQQTADDARTYIGRLTEVAAAAEARFQRAGQAAIEARRTMEGFAPIPLPPVPPVPTAPPRATGGSSGNTQDRETRQAIRLLERLADQQRQPVEDFTHNLTEAGDAITRLGSTATVGYETLSRAAVNGAREAVDASQAIKGEADTAAAASIAAAEAFGQRMVQIGRMSAEQYEAMMVRVRDATANASQAAGKASEGTTGFWGALSTSLGGNQMGLQPDMETEIGTGLGKELSGTLDTLAGYFEKVASGAMTAADAVKQFGLDFVKAVTMMVAKAAALALIRMLLGSIGGPTKAGFDAPVWGPAPTGVPGFMAGGAVAGGHAILVGERGPEIFTPPGSGRIVPNHELGGGAPQVNIVNNAPGVVIDQTHNDDRTISLAVNLSRQRVAADFAESTRTGFGAYAEPLNARYAMRRRT